MESLNDRRNWNVFDPNEGIPLELIEPLSSRAHSLVARSNSPLLYEHFMQIGGVISILSGLTYHHDNFAALRRALKAGFRNDYAPLQHEAVAWVNRVGQLYYFSKSGLVQRLIGSVPVPTIKSVMPFRNKHVAHRSIDSPRNEDDSQAKVLHAMSMSAFGGILWIPKTAGMPARADVRPPIETHYLAFQIRGKDNAVHNLALERDHPLVLREGYDVLSMLLANEGA